MNGGLGQHFKTGSIYWSPRTGAWDVRGAIRDKWFSMAAERGLLGMPVGVCPSPSSTIVMDGRYFFPVAAIVMEFESFSMFFRSSPKR